MISRCARVGGLKEESSTAMCGWASLVEYGHEGGPCTSLKAVEDDVDGESRASRFGLVGAVMRAWRERRAAARASDNVLPACVWRYTVQWRERIFVRSRPGSDPSAGNFRRKHAEPSERSRLQLQMKV